MAILVHLINNWQMNPDRKRTLLAASLLSAWIFTVTAAHADEQQAKDVTAAKPGTVFRDCPDCPEMVVVPAGSFNMGSPESEKVWATKHGASPESVSDEAPQHRVRLRSFAIGKYDVTRGEYAAFVRKTGYPAGDGCFESSMPKANKRPDARWQNPGFNQTDRDPVVCISWPDARAYVAWLNNKIGGQVLTSGDGPYRLPSEAEWEYAARGGTTTPFWWGNDDRTAADHAWFKNNSDGHPILSEASPRTRSVFTTWSATSGNGRMIVMPIATQRHRRTEAQRKARMAACALIAAVAGCTRAGFCAQPRAREIRLISAMSLWDSA